MVKHRQEYMARMVLVLILIGLPVAIFGFQWVGNLFLAQTRIVDIHMTMPESGGFSQDYIQINTDETVTLKFYADDVTHGIAIGPGLGIDLGAIDAGDVKETMLTFDQPGTYTYYCTTWCSPNHWRMRGTIHVRDANNTELVPTGSIDPVIVNLQVAGINIDDDRFRFTPLQDVNLSLNNDLEGWLVPPRIEDLNWQRTHTPVEASDMLSIVNPNQTSEAVYGAIASLWLAKPSNPPINSQYLYNQNCAACHGQTGFGDGPGAYFTPVLPAMFGDTAYMFTMRGDVLYAKIRRGGMGTNMPNFGTIFTPEDTWALVDYLWRLAFKKP